ncbi:MAG: aromatic aminobenezylarsenical efflux permease ArsG family transporter [Acidobacteria bacterium]|nr:aromatic aminobenezylarsenical efflux permease ArsG family transporter [Acidobacteriota bacterium]
MEITGLALVSALWLGLLTSISPCPLATNIAAVSFVGSRVGSPRRVLLAGALYTAGRSLAYLVLGATAVWGLMSLVEVSSFLQGPAHKALGPLMIAVGLLLLGVFTLDVGGGRLAASMQGRAERWGVWGALPLGVVFALAFCPVSAGLFFGSLLPLALSRRSPLLLPGVYGLGTAIPVVIFAVLIALGVSWLGRAFEKVTTFELWARRTTGAVFVVVGVYETLRSFGVAG